MTTQDDVLSRIDTWKIGGAFLMIFVILLTLFSFKLWTDLDKVVTERQEETRRANIDSVARCFSQSAQSPALQTVLRVLANETSDERSRRVLLDFAIVNARAAPKKAECVRLAEDLNVPVPKGVD